jgi:hypothetical protein
MAKAVTGCDGTKLARAAPTTAWVVSIIREIPSWRTSIQTTNADRTLQLSWTFCPEIGSPNVYLLPNFGYVAARFADINLK